MVAFNFTVFIDKVESGEKRRTIRQKQRCKPGDKLQLYTGMMHKGCRKLRDAICTNVQKVIFYETHLWLGEEILVESVDAFAQADGFRDYEHLVGWFKETYPDKAWPITMYLHEWDPLPKGEEGPIKKRHPRPRRYPKKRKL